MFEYYESLKGQECRLCNTRGRVEGTLYYMHVTVISKVYSTVCNTEKCWYMCSVLLVMSLCRGNSIKVTLITSNEDDSPK